MYSFNWPRFVRIMLANFMRKMKHVAWLEVVVSQIKRLHAIFIIWQEEILFKLSYNSQIMNLEKRLNDKWDNVNRGIYIDNVADFSRKYLYNKIEQRKGPKLHNRWNPATNYSFAQHVSWKRHIYRSLTVNTNSQPDTNPLDWFPMRERDWLFNLSEFQLANDFIVYVPVAVIFDINEMKAVINFYKIAPKRYTIITY